VGLRFVLIARSAKHPDTPPAIIRSWVLGLLAVVTAIAIREHFGYFIGRDPCVAFLFALIGIKYLETRRFRDGTLIVCLACLLIVTPFFYSQSLLAAAAAIPAVILLGGTLQTLSRPPTLGGMQGGWKTPLFGTIKMFAQAIPLAVILFLLFPLDVIDDEEMAHLVLHDCSKYLAGAHGIRRYLGDSYWAPDCEARLSEMDRTRDFSDDLAARDTLLPKIGDEAQWCLFDPILSAYFGRRYLKSRSVADRERQIVHFNRSLAQITDNWRCAELYYLRDGEYVANPHVPLQWTQANLTVALDALRATIASDGR
jgi:hypothetical protein